MNDVFRRSPTGALALSVAVLLSGCQQRELLVPKIPGLEPYRMTIQQGNNLSQEMVAQLKLGMTREQVRFVLGTPLLMDVFHADRWDYVYFLEVPGGKREQRNLSVVFDKDKLVRVLGDLVPPEGTAVQPTGFVPQVKPEAPAKPAAAAAKPAAEAAKPAAEAPKPAAEAPQPVAESWETKQNWTSGTQASEAPPAPTAGEEAKTPEDKKADESAPKPAAEAQEPGFFERMRQKLGL
jgi:outer membrane protein assembly factor BamE